MSNDHRILARLGAVAVLVAAIPYAAAQETPETAPAQAQQEATDEAAGQRRVEALREVFPRNAATRP